MPETASSVEARRPAPPARTPAHHADHGNLLAPASSASAARVHAIIVPTARPVQYLRTAVAVASDLGCPLLALCSGYASAKEARHLGKDIIAVDVGGNGRLPRFSTSRLLADTRFARRTDTSLKRNIGLAVARMAGWETVVFLDDDIVVDNPDDLRTAAGLLGKFDAVGLWNEGFPDNSVVCHGLRAVGKHQGSFIGGGAMAVPAQRVRSFFPNIYNEDWFFLLDSSRLSAVTATGRVDQKPFDPFRDDRRARYEEFGDCMAEGIYALLDEGRRVQDADATYWEQFLEDRRQLIDGVLALVPDAPGLTPEERRRMTVALKAAQGRRELITPALCVGYLRAWAEDRKAWQDFLRRLSPRDPASALARLGFPPALPDAYRSR